MRRFFLFALFLSFALWAITGDPAAAEFSLATPVAQASSAPTVDQILSNYVRALGGEEAYHKLKTRVMKGAIHTTGGGEVGSIEIYETAPDKGTSTTFFPGDLPVRRGYNGSKGWIVDPDEGPQDATDDSLKDIQKRFDFFRDLKIKEEYPGMAYRGTESLDGHVCNVTEFKRPDGSSEKFYFDQETGLLVRHDVPSSEGVPRQMVMSEYRQVDGIQYPFRVRITDPEFEAVIDYTEIRHNVPIDESQFEKPAR
jgi:hypothetical protein